MREDSNLLNGIYRFDSVFLKLNEIYNKWKNTRRKDKHIVTNQKDVILLRLKQNFTKYPNILLNQLTEVNFRCKDCFKVYLIMYKFMLKRNNMRFKCKKEYLRKMVKIHRNSLERVLKELEEKNMVLIEKENGYFYFTLNLSFENWLLTNKEKERIILNNEMEIRRWQERFLDDEQVFIEIEN